MVEPDRPHDNIIQRMRFACWITKATDTHSECVILIAFPRQIEHASMFIHTFLVLSILDLNFSCTDIFCWLYVIPSITCRHHCGPNHVLAAVVTLSSRASGFIHFSTMLISGFSCGLVKAFSLLGC